MTSNRLNKIKLIHENYDCYLSKSKFHHNLTNFRHHHILDENERDINSQLFITFDVKSTTSMGNSSTV